MGTLGVVVPSWVLVKAASRASIFLAPLIRAPRIPLGLHKRELWLTLNWMVYPRSSLDDKRP